MRILSTHRTAYMCFLANQTGNSILVYVGAFGLLENHQRFINVSISLGCFLVSCMLGGQLGNHFGRVGFPVPNQIAQGRTRGADYSYSPVVSEEA